MSLSASQKAILKAYAKECAPKGAFSPEDMKVLNEGKYIHKEQNHITDKGLAYVVAEMNYPFTKFLNAHKWQGRLRIFLDFAKRAFNTNAELDIYFKAKYKANLQFDTWGSSGQEQQLPNHQLKQFVCVMFLDLLENPAIDWKKVRGLFHQASAQSFDFEAMELMTKVKSREELQGYFRQALTELQEQKS